MQTKQITYLKKHTLYKLIKNDNCFQTLTSTTKYFLMSLHDRYVQKVRLG